jgi:predicted Zn-dependent peptidase
MQNMKLTQSVIVEHIHGDTSYASFVFVGQPNSPSINILYDLLSFVLAGGSSSILFNELREKHGYIYNVFSKTLSYVNNGAFVISFQTTEKDIYKLVKIVLWALHKLRKEGMSSKQMGKIRASFAMQETIKYSDPMTFLIKCAYDKFYGHSYHRSTQSYLKSIEEIDHQDFDRFLKNALDISRMVISIRTHCKKLIGMPITKLMSKFV